MGRGRGVLRENELPRTIHRRSLECISPSLGGRAIRIHHDDTNGFRFISLSVIIGTNSDTRRASVHPSSLSEKALSPRITTEAFLIYSARAPKAIPITPAAIAVALGASPADETLAGVEAEALAAVAPPEGAEPERVVRPIAYPS